MVWLSVLVPVYNVKPYLHECLASVVEQAGDDAGIQILVLDDSSTDGSWPLLQELAQRWPGRLQLLQHARNSGLSAARNTLIDAAQGRYLWFLDSDDKLLPDAVARLRAIVQAHAPDVVLCDFSVWRERPRFKHRLRGERHRRSFKGPARQLVNDRCTLVAGMLATGQLHAWSKISRRALWGQDLRFPPGRYFEDMVTMPLMALRAQSFYYEPQPWVAYRQRASSILSTMSLPKAIDQSTALLPLAQALPDAVPHRCRRTPGAGAAGGAQPDRCAASCVPISGGLHTRRSPLAHCRAHAPELLRHLAASAPGAGASLPAARLVAAQASVFALVRHEAKAMSPSLSPSVQLTQRPVRTRTLCGWRSALQRTGATP